MQLDVGTAISPNYQVENYQPSISDSAYLQKLGRQRPAIFGSIFMEIGFCFSMLASMLLCEYFISGFNTILPTLTTALDIPQEAKAWPASVFSLVTGAFLSPAARLADIHGAHIVFNAGFLWFFVCCLIGGFSQNNLMLILCRALQGLGPAAFLPSGIMLLGTIYRPGLRKNLVFSLYGAFSPIGFYSGITVGGLSGHYLTWRWYFWIGSIMLFFVLIISLLSLPSTHSSESPSTARMDWWGCLTIIPGLLLVVYAFTDGTHAPNGWQTPYIPIALLLGVALPCAAFYVEGWISPSPLLPFDLFKVKYMTHFSCHSSSHAVFSESTFSTPTSKTILQKNPITTAIWFAPMAAGGLLLIPDNPNYWAWIFPTMLAATIGADITYSVSNIFITTKLPQHRQRVAGAVIDSTVFLGISFFLGVADLAVSETRGDLGVKRSYKVGFWVGVACAGVAAGFLGFVRVGRAGSELTVEERERERLRGKNRVV
ncbi:hypothetical protein BBP40_001253 [Aspergillus hancockii]|nr:hypothetical protein BBP40_001253 [Aspergillus hancockii]